MMRNWLVAAALGLLAAVSAAQSQDKVLGRWSDGWYVGTVLQKVGDQYKVLFDDGDEALLPQSGIRPIDWAAGSRVQCNFKGAGRYYWGVIEQKSGPRVGIKYDDGDREVTVIGRCRVPLK